MSETQDTVAEPVTETEVLHDNGTATASEEAAASDVKETKEESVAREAYEQLQKELNQTKQELNLRRNKEKELEAKRLEESGEYKTLADQYKQELDEIRASQEKAEQERESKEFRSEILKQYPEAVQEIANDLDLWWDTPGTAEEAKEQLATKLDKIAAKVGAPKTTVEAPEDAPEVLANNPSTSPVEDTELDRLKKMSLDDLKKILPKAESR